MIGIVGETDALAARIWAQEFDGIFLNRLTSGSSGQLGSVRPGDKLAFGCDEFSELAKKAAVDNRSTFIFANESMAAFGFTVLNSVTSFPSNLAADSRSAFLNLCT